MPGSIDYLIWFASALFEAAAVVCSIRSRTFLRYITLNLYLIADLLLALGRYSILMRNGFSSDQYVYFYYYSDAFLTVCLYFALMGLYSHVFHEMGVERYLRVGTLLLLAGTAWVSYQIIAGAEHRMVTRFVVELSQNLYFVGVVLTYLLWGAIMKLRETRTRLIQLVLALGVYFSAFAANYALRNIYPQFPLWRYLPPIMGILLPLSWAYTFLKVPEEARLATARVATPTR